MRLYYALTCFFWIADKQEKEKGRNDEQRWLYVLKKCVKNLQPLLFFTDCGTAWTGSGLQDISVNIEMMEQVLCLSDSVKTVEITLYAQQKHLSPREDAK